MERLAPIVLRLRFARLDVAAGFAAIGDELRHRADARHATNRFEAFAIAGAVGRPLLVWISIHRIELNTRPSLGNSGKALR